LQWASTWVVTEPITRLPKCAVAVGTHDQQVELAGVGQLGDQGAGGAHLPIQLGLNAMPLEELGDRRQHLVCLFSVVLVHGGLAQRGFGAWGQRGLRMEHGVLVAGREQRVVCAQVGQHFLL